MADTSWHVPIDAQQLIKTTLEKLELVMTALASMTINI